MPGIYRDPRVGTGLLAFGILMFFVFVASAYMIATQRQHCPNTSILVSSIWVVGVPLYFFFEHVVIFRKYGDPEQYEQFKRVQDLASKIWAAAIVVLAAFYFQTFPK
jgi:hypothetical protein